ncbi:MULTISPECIES: phosphomannomutase/phosphoglucomutase [unclassified Sphingopyxis]|uniref:phosphoglucomutase/phosphomannomutase PgmG n=1 Tax=unclassified Sphingopyxis TaxID=2614943 RepID=UPI000731DDD1|nr:MULTISPECIES: phosphomannomutase/phosphoglucomutase [unclassified Sphingopyxis]KTE25130.1 phosphomannomutase [Sphingopyxis sp. H057]KTE53700.1 phosphomannomutase [Sphingopyxis sp. H073]KTE56292.1 phosphomannomutase [Sphingopyxis sp. H071]KTE61985.1 phosphomannomutase [Sphingopyxis sp. H107]KTE67258.1 phosphomannomutase [Sphingopyxis sp. H100]
MTHIFHASMLREYDIRGVVGDTLSAADAYAIGRSFATLIKRAGGKRIAVGYDGRLSSPMLEAALVEGINAAGIDALRVGLGPTPMLYYAASTEDVDGGIQITGSHNPPDYNGFKMVFQGRPFFGADIQRIGEIAAAGDWEAVDAGGEGTSESIDIVDAYVDRLVEGFAGGAFRIGWDAGNGAAGTVIEKLTARLPGEHHLLFTDIDGHFPNHHPDPTVEANLADLRKLVAEKSLDFGVAFDGDGDRIGAIDGQGRVIWGDQLLQIYAEAALQEIPGATIIADVKASQALFDRIAEMGGKPLMWKTGHSLIKAKMKETGSPLAGEMSGHIFFADRYYGYDDAPYAAVRLIEAAHKLGKSVTELRGDMPAMVNTPEMRFQVDEVRKFAIVDEVLQRLSSAGANVDRTDGARVMTNDGWWLLRASNTQDVLVARAEAKDEAALERLIAAIDDQLEQSGVVRGPQAAH